MGIKYSMPVDCIPDLRQKKVAVIADPTASDANVATRIAAIIDVLQAYSLVATA